MTRKDAREQQARNRLQNARWEVSPPIVRVEALTIVAWLGLLSVGALTFAAVTS